MSDFSEDEYEYEYDSDVASVTSMTDPTDSFGDSDSGSQRKSGSFATSPHNLPYTSQQTAAVAMWQTPQAQEALRNLVEEAASALGVSPAAAMPLLRQCEWNLQSLLQCFFADSEKTLQKAGVEARCQQESSMEMENLPGSDETDKTCLICMDEIGDDSLAMGCGHEFCKDCWGDYLTNVIQHEGGTCVKAACPQTECSEVITEVEVQAAAPQLLAKFQHYQLQAFVESNPQLRWCPGKGCDRIAHCNGVVKSANSLKKQQQSASITAACDGCDSTFCFTCGADDVHAPATCEQLTLWKEKNASGDSETANWMTVNTKPCPKCGKRIEKNGGCMYIKCTKCSHGFCWMCLGVHHVWSCNAYKEQVKQSNEVDEKIRAKNELERYLHYYQRFDGHEKALHFAQKQLETCRAKEFTENEMTVDNDKKDAPVNRGVVDIPLLIEANQQIVRCRQVLMSSYVFAYYHFLPNKKREKEDIEVLSSSTDKIQKECFEQHQGILEGMTEGLSKVTEMPRDEMDRQDVVNRSRAIGQFIKNVLEYVEKG